MGKECKQYIQGKACGRGIKCAEGDPYFKPLKPCSVFKAPSTNLFNKWATRMEHHDKPPRQSERKGDSIRHIFWLTSTQTFREVDGRLTLVKHPNSLRGGELCGSLLTKALRATNLMPFLYCHRISYVELSRRTKVTAQSLRLTCNVFIRYSLGPE